MPNTCPHCEEKFDNWVSYNEHLAFSHWKNTNMSQSPFHEEEATEGVIAAIRTCSTGRTDLVRRAWIGYMPTGEKRRIVAAWENKQKQGAII